MQMSVLERCFVVLMLSGALLSCGSAKHSSSKRIAGKWQTAPVSIDGKNTEWQANEYDEKAMIGYSVTNDKDNLYIMVHTGDLATQLKILNEGLTVWIDRTGEKNEQTAINFPIPADHKTRAPSENFYDENLTPDKVRVHMEDRVKVAMTHATEYSLQGFKSCNLQYPITEKDSCGIVVQMSVDGELNELVWEAVVPFRAFFFKNEITRADKGRPLSITIETTASKRPEGKDGAPRRSNNNNAPRARPGVSFGVGGMGMGMNMGGGNRYGNGGPVQPSAADITEQLYKSTKTYKRFGLGFQ